jgi:dCTP deaminase
VRLNVLLKADYLANQIERDRKGKARDPLLIAPLPNLDELRQSGSAAVDLRLGTWFMELRGSRMALLTYRDDRPHDNVRSSVIGRADPTSAPARQRSKDEVSISNTQQRLTRMRYVRFGDDYILHPRAFVLASTLEWLRIPSNLAGYVVGRSSWGRRGLIIATATGVHPGFKGCLTLELTNAGEIPIAISPGLTICQLFFHTVLAGKSQKDAKHVDRSKFVGVRRPALGDVEPDELAKQLGAAYSLREDQQ